MPISLIPTECSFIIHHNLKKAYSVKARQSAPVIKFSIYYVHQKSFYFNIYLREFTAAINQPCSKAWLRMGESDVKGSKIPHGYNNQHRKLHGEQVPGFCRILLPLIRDILHVFLHESRQACSILFRSMSSTSEDIFLCGELF